MGNAKGDRAENQLADTLWEWGYAPLRAPGSGTKDQPSPDIFAVKGEILDVHGQGLKTVSECYAIEVKSDPDGTALFNEKDKNEISELREFASRAGARALVAVKPDMRRKGHDQWYVREASALHETPGGNFSIRQQDHDECLGLKEVFKR